MVAISRVIYHDSATLPISPIRPTLCFLSSPDSPATLLIDDYSKPLLTISPLNHALCFIPTNSQTDLNFSPRKSFSSTTNQAPRLLASIVPSLYTLVNAVPAPHISPFMFLALLTIHQTVTIPQHIIIHSSILSLSFPFHCPLLILLITPINLRSTSTCPSCLTPRVTPGVLLICCCCSRCPLFRGTPAAHTAPIPPRYFLSSWSLPSGYLSHVLRFLLLIHCDQLIYLLLPPCISAYAYMSFYISVVLHTIISCVAKNMLTVFFFFFCREKRSLMVPSMFPTARRCSCFGV